MGKIVERLSKILNRAERAEEGSPEHEAFMARAIQLSQAYSIDSPSPAPTRPAKGRPRSASTRSASPARTG